jgi:ADP-ribose pyrophosphatase YjhB (NUDIX family)
MKYCSECGFATENRIPPEDNRLRAICKGCSKIHYVNPKVVVGSMSTWKNKILLCRRAIEPRKGFWTLPAGFMELGESTSEGAKRETIEESGADVELNELFAVFDIPTFNQVHIFYLAEMKSSKLDPGVESLEAKLFTKDEIPWSELSFASVKKALELFYGVSNQNLPRVHTALITSK